MRDSVKRTVVPCVMSGVLAWGGALWARPYGRMAELAVASAVLAVVYVALACVMARDDVAQLLVRLRMGRAAALLERRRG